MYDKLWDEMDHSCKNRNGKRVVIDKQLFSLKMIQFTQNSLIYRGVRQLYFVCSIMTIFCDKGQKKEADAHKRENSNDPCLKREELRKTERIHKIV